MREESGFRLGNAAAPGVGKIAVEQDAHGQRSGDRHQHASPRGASHGIEAHSQPLGYHDKGDNCESGKRSYQQRKKKKYLLLTLLKMRNQARPKNDPPSLPRLALSGCSKRHRNSLRE